MEHLTNRAADVSTGVAGIGVIVSLAANSLPMIQAIAGIVSIFAGSFACIWYGLKISEHFTKKD